MTTQDAQKESPSLDEWMSKIREKKLKPVVPNQHKLGETKDIKGDKAAGAHNANEIVKMRQGLRTVSTPKWPGPNDSKTKASSNILPQRTQLRSVSGRLTSTETLPKTESTPSEGAIADSGTKQELDHPSSTTNIAQQGQTSMISDSNKQSTSAATEPDTEFPLDTVNSADVASAVDETPENLIGANGSTLSVSSGVTEEVDVKLVLPEKVQDAFPLDLEKELEDTRTVAEDLNTPPTPVTISSGVFDTNEKTLDLKLPARKKEEFPLDLETSQGETSHQPSTGHEDLAPASGVTDPDIPTPTLESPPKGHSKSKKSKKSKKARNLQAKDEDSKNEKSELAAIETEGNLEPSEISSQSDQDTISTRTTQTQAESVITTPGQAEEAIKCSQCSIQIPLTELSNHKCQINH